MFPIEWDSDGNGDSLVLARLLPARPRSLHRAHDDEPEARDEEEPEGPPVAGALSGRARQDLLPEGLPQAAAQFGVAGARGAARKTEAASTAPRDTASREGLLECPFRKGSPASSCPRARSASGSRELGRRITVDYAGRDLVLVTVLRGGVFFLADLCRAIDLPLQARVHGGLDVRRRAGRACPGHEGPRRGHRGGVGRRRGGHRRHGADPELHPRCARGPGPSEPGGVCAARQGRASYRRPSHRVSRIPDTRQLRGRVWSRPCGDTAQPAVRGDVSTRESSKRRWLLGGER